MSLPNRSEILSTINDITGLVVSRIQFIIYEYKQQIKKGNIFPELSFGNGLSILFTSGGYGESLSVELSPWNDPFAGELSPDNLEFIETYGQWKRIDASALEPYQHLINHVVSEIIPIDQFDKLIGVKILINGYSLSFNIEWDEGHVSCESCIP